MEGCGNLGLVLNHLRRTGAWKNVLRRLQMIYEDLDDVTVNIQGGTVQVFVHERGLIEPIPATRLSDGALRFLCLVAILTHPEPPPLIALEKPELGLHPDFDLPPENCTT